MKLHRTFRVDNAIPPRSYEICSVAKCGRPENQLWLMPPKKRRSPPWELA